MGFLELPPLPEAYTRPWPENGGVYWVVFEVEIDDPMGDPEYTLLLSPIEVRESVYDMDFQSLITKDQLPIASGIYTADLKFWSRLLPRSFEDLHDEWDYGYDLSNLEKIF